MPILAITNFNIVCSVLGGFITLFGLVSYLFKEKLYLSEAREWPRALTRWFLTVMSGRSNIAKALKRTNQIVGFQRS
jgi:hypothetical protein